MQRCQGQPSTCAIAFFRPAVADDQLHPGQPALDQVAQERAPERLRLRFADVEADHLSVAGLVHGVGEHQCLPDDLVAVADLLHLRVEPQVRIRAFERPVAKGVDLLVETGAGPRRLALEIRSPSDSTTWSTLRVETPATYASCTTETSACSLRRRGSKKLGK